MGAGPGIVAGATPLAGAFSFNLRKSSSFNVLPGLGLISGVFICLAINFLSCCAQKEV